MSEDLAREAHNRADFFVAERGIEPRHRFAAVHDDIELAGIVEPIFDRIECRPETAAPCRAMASRTPFRVHLLTQHELIVRVGWKGRRFGTPGGSKGETCRHDERSESAAGAMKHRVTILGAMGFDPNRPHRKSPFDYVFVAAAIIVAVGLILWAFFA